MIVVEVSTPSLHDGSIQSVAICAGSGGSMLKDIDADVYWTGEMSHVRATIRTVAS